MAGADKLDVFSLVLHKSDDAFTRCTQKNGCLDSLKSQTRANLGYAVAQSILVERNVMGSAVRRIQIQEYQDTSEQPDRLDWIPVYFEPFLWKPPGLEPADIGWFVNLIEASLKSELQGYLQVEGPETLWRIAGAKHPESWKLHCSKVLAHFERTQMHGHDWLYFPPLVRMIEKQRKKLQGKRSRNPKNPQKSEGGAGFSLPLVFDSDVGIGFKTQQVENVDMDSEAKTPGNMPEEPLKSARRIIDILGMP